MLAGWTVATTSDQPAAGHELLPFRQPSNPPPDPACEDLMTIPTHRVTLTYPDNSMSTHDVVGEQGLWALARAAQQAHASSGHAVVLEPDVAAFTVLLGIGWTSSVVTPQDCPHFHIDPGAVEQSMTYTVACRSCLKSWSFFDDLDLPEEVLQRALPVWMAHGL